MNRMLSALRVLERRPGTSPGDAKSTPAEMDAPKAAAVSAESTSAPAEPDLDFAGQIPAEAESTLERLDAAVARAGALVEGLLDDDSLEPSAGVQAVPPAPRQRAEQRAPAPDVHDLWPPLLFAGSAPAVNGLPPVDLPVVEPGPDYRRLAQRIADDVLGRDRRWPILLVAARPDALAAFDLTALATALATEAGLVLLVDCRRDGLGRASYTSHTPEPGLNQLIAGSATWPQVTRPTNLPGVHFVGAGSAEAPATHGSVEAARVWRHLPFLDRHVLVAGGSADHPLARAIAGCSAATYLIVELGRDHTGAIHEALSDLRTAGANVRGAIALDRANPHT